jgi:hypothetical protein
MQLQALCFCASLKGWWPEKALKKGAARELSSLTLLLVTMQLLKKRRMTPISHML